MWGFYNEEDKHRSDVGGSGCFVNESGIIVLYLLEFRKKMLRTACQNELQ